LGPWARKQSKDKTQWMMESRSMALRLQLFPWFLSFIWELEAKPWDLEGLPRDQR
jgi:hypothetical protein